MTPYAYTLFFELYEAKKTCRTLYPQKTEKKKERPKFTRGNESADVYVKGNTEQKLKITRSRIDALRRGVGVIYAFTISKNSLTRSREKGCRRRSPL